MLDIRQALPFLLLFSSAALAMDDVTCKHETGHLTFRGLNVKVQKKDSSVVVSRIDESGSLTKDYWTYRLVAENPNYGFRATRLGTESGLPSDSMLDIYFGGEIVLVKDGTSMSLFSVTINAESGISEHEKLKCT